MVLHVFFSSTTFNSSGRREIARNSSDGNPSDVKFHKFIRRKSFRREITRNSFGRQFVRREVTKQDPEEDEKSEVEVAESISETEPDACMEISEKEALC